MKIVISVKHYSLVYFFTLVIFMKPVLSENNEKNWELIDDENNIQVYILTTKFTQIVKAKTTTVVKSPMQKVKSILDDIEHRHEWIPFLEVSTALTNYKNNKRIEYSHFYGPWPTTDRDFVYEIELVTQTDNQLVYKMVSVKSNLMPENNDKIRADLFETRYTLTAIDKDTTAIELIYHADPKGWLPNWVINIMQRILPYRILNNLKIRLKNNK
jgi:START domain-containing protein